MSVLPPIGAESIDSDQIRTFKEFLINYNKVSELCFTDCVTDFTTRSVKPKEEKCAYTCMEKFLKTNQRISQRFSEFQMLANENALAAAQKIGQASSS